MRAIIFFLISVFLFTSTVFSQESILCVSDNDIEIERIFQVCEHNGNNLENDSLQKDTCNDYEIQSAEKFTFNKKLKIKNTLTKVKYSGFQNKEIFYVLTNKYILNFKTVYVKTHHIPNKILYSLSLIKLLI